MSILVLLVTLLNSIVVAKVDSKFSSSLFYLKSEDSPLSSFLSSSSIMMLILLLSLETLLILAFDVVLSFLCQSFIYEFLLRR